MDGVPNEVWEVRGVECITALHDIVDQILHMEVDDSWTHVVRGFCVQAMIMKKDSRVVCKMIDPGIVKEEKKLFSIRGVVLYDLGFHPDDEWSESALPTFEVLGQGHSAAHIEAICCDAPARL